MATARFEAKYKVRRQGSNSWGVSSLSGIVGSQSETLVMQKIRDRHRGYEIELTSIKWK